MKYLYVAFASLIQKKQMWGIQLQSHTRPNTDGNGFRHFYHNWTTFYFTTTKGVSIRFFGARSSNKPPRDNLLTYSDLFMVSPTYQLI
jgi:hypothetical protein